MLLMFFYHYKFYDAVYKIEKEIKQYENENIPQQNREIQGQINVDIDSNEFVLTILIPLNK